jgi:hypothetical protein
MRVSQVGFECAFRVLGAPGKLGQHRRPRATGLLAGCNLAEFSDRNGKLRDAATPSGPPHPRTRNRTCLNEPTGSGPSVLVAEDEPPLGRSHARNQLTCVRRRDGTPRRNLAWVLVESAQRG